MISDAAKTQAGGQADYAPGQTIYDFYPNAADLLDELLPQTVKTALKRDEFAVASDLYFVGVAKL